ncbi:hypothetical protein CLV82_0501 [Zeaxanthinibacter enoshimensis]|uniref:Uncharacterized protein n=1 Tax=Zeaxanthinibacter enoshimensis TaxID=392009 RepID=A0A4R6TUQ6_9FLAO|nr:hypothetical protein CLV82_0501 [Zeaxanthinibacter enoshimensis]
MVLQEDHDIEQHDNVRSVPEQFKLITPWL